MLLHWEQLPLYYGSELIGERHRFEKAGETTHALLCCRLAAGDDRVASSGGEHAEAKLLRSPLWTEEVPAALAAWSPLDRGAIVVTLVINRSPCRGCTEQLEQALIALQWEFPASFPHARFLLASRGAYQGRLGPEDYYSSATTVGGLGRLRNAGWELCVLQVGAALSARGRELLQAIDRLSGSRTRVARLGG